MLGHRLGTQLGHLTQHSNSSVALAAKRCIVTVEEIVDDLQAPMNACVEPEDAPEVSPEAPEAHVDPDVPRAPGGADATAAERLAAFERTLGAIRQRIAQLVQLPPEQLQAGALQAAARALAQDGGAAA